MGNFKEDIARTEAFIFDVDGVMTDGGIIPTLDGDFIRRYNAKDGYALGYAVKMGYKVCIITGGRGKTLETACGCWVSTATTPTAWTKSRPCGNISPTRASTPRTRSTWATTSPIWSACARWASGLPGRRRGRSDRGFALRLGVPGRRRGRARHCRAGAPRPRRLGEKLRGRHPVVAGGVAVNPPRKGHEKPGFLRSPAFPYTA